VLLCETWPHTAMMRASHPPEKHSRLLPEGRRWGFGAHTVVPYLTMSHNARAGDDAALASIRNPVFAEMQAALRALRERH